MLYFISTPIGNLKDISYRAIETLNASDEIYCEDTRHSLRLLDHYNIKKPLFSYHKFNEKGVTEKIVEKLNEGKTISVISDAGTPVLSDPGGVLAKELRERGISYSVIPGANAVLPALILSGMDATNFYFAGFLPDRNRDRARLLENIKNLQATLVFYCAPHDIEDITKSLLLSLGDRRAVVVREITKIYESATPFMLSEGYLGETRGEMVLVVEGASSTLENVDAETLIKQYQDEGLSKMEALKKAAKTLNVPKSSLYKFTIE